MKEEHVLRPRYLPAWRAASRSSSDSMSPTVPPWMMTSVRPSFMASMSSRILMGDVRDHLDGVPQEVHGALASDDRGHAGGHVGSAGQYIQEAFVVPDVREVGLI